MLNDKVILVTGGTGSFGRSFARTVLARYRPKRLIIFSRDELKQVDMKLALGGGDGCLRFVLGDVRDTDALHRAFRGVDVVIHAAALKQVPSAEDHPLEVIKTNILGTANVIGAALNARVRRVLALSSDKAANPINLYGATKLCGDKLFTAADRDATGTSTRFTVVRYGNVLGSSGSVVPLFLKMRRTGCLPITDPRMTRFWITVSQGVDFVLSCLEKARGGEVFIPKIPSMRVIDLAKAIAPECQTRVVGIRPGEKLHEVLVSEDDARQTLEYEDRYVIAPPRRLGTAGPARRNGGTPCAEDFRYSSDRNAHWLSADQLRSMLEINS